MSASSPAFLAKCEEFLLHPRVRELSLAQRVDFLENKGLSPDEITACLKNVQLRNGLARAISQQLPSTGSGGLMSVFGGDSSKLTWTQWVLLHGGAAAVVLMLTHGFQRVRQRMEEDAASAQRAERLRRRAARNARIAAMLLSLKEQHQQYSEALTKLRERAQALVRARAAAQHKRQTLVTTGQRTRATKTAEMAALEQQVATLKRAVIQAFAAPTEQKNGSMVKQTEAQPTLGAGITTSTSSVTSHEQSDIEETLEQTSSFRADSGNIRPIAVT